ncbi:hypothetical protein BC835DRAFT_1399011 [Cytidiella melzeri]|nr:hypothetical protein BC835DRAFT_1399011 [Cytidiella melzeri]
MQLSTSLLLIATIVTGAVHTVSVSAIPYSSTFRPLSTNNLNWRLDQSSFHSKRATSARQPGLVLEALQDDEQYIARRKLIEEFIEETRKEIKKLENERNYRYPKTSHNEEEIEAITDQIKTLRQAVVSAKKQLEQIDLRQQTARKFLENMHPPLTDALKQ